MNYFELFECPVSFEVDNAALSEQYLALQKLYHPDRHVGDEAKDKLQVMQKAAEINDAYTTLKDNILRAEYILKLRGLDIQHETKTIQDPSFLMQQMEFRERLEELNDLNDPFDEILAFERDIDSDANALERELADLLKDEQQNEASANIIRKLKFMAKLRHELERLEDELVEI